MTVKSRKGITAKSFSGLNKKRMQKTSSANFGKRIMLQKGDTLPVQFLQLPEDMKEFDVHTFREDGKWYFIPCLGDSCPLCEDEDAERRKVSYRFVCNVYNLKDRKVQLLEGPKDLASRISYRYERKPGLFLKRTFDITKFNTSPVTYDVAVGEDDIVKVTDLKLEDLQAYIDEEAKRFYGEEMPSGKSSLDAKDDDDDIDENDDGIEGEGSALQEELELLSDKKLIKRAIANGSKKADLTELETEELIELIITQEADGDDADEDETPPPTKRSAAKKSPAKRAR